MVGDSICPSCTITQLQGTRGVCALRALVLFVILAWNTICENKTFDLFTEMVQGQNVLCCNYICWPSPSNQSFYRQITGYQRGVGDHWVGQWWEGPWTSKLITRVKKYICLWPTCMIVCVQCVRVCCVYMCVCTFILSEVFLWMWKPKFPVS